MFLPFTINLPEKLMNVCTSQHALSTREPFGLITAMLSPIAAGGRVVMLKQFDTIQVWSHILGIVVNHPQPLPKVDLGRNCRIKYFLNCNC